MFETKNYSFHLPEELVAAEALSARDASRLLVVHKNEHRIEHRMIRDLPSILTSNHLIVANNTKVFRARLPGRRKGTDGKIEFFMLTRMGPKSWKGLMRSAARILPGFEFIIGEGSREITGRVIAREENPAGVLLTAEFSEDPARSGWGEVPLPPYIVSKRTSQNKAIDHPSEIERYNTEFAKIEGSVAAPTAGRHFTAELISRLKAQGIEWNELTLHVGLGTFKPVTVQDVREHEMHAEEVAISEQLADHLNVSKAQGKKILAIGTTTTRALEGRSLNGRLQAGQQPVNLFIHPGSHHQWQTVDAMLTNFHLPESTLLMMVADFIGDLSWTREIYQTAIHEQYRFYSYGDAMLILE